MQKPLTLSPHSVMIAVVLATVMWVSAGSLTPPPGPVSPTMKNLLDVEPRTAIRNDPNFAAPIVISFPGSYYLAEDISAIFGQNGITIDASHVTLDLNGFTVYGNLEVGSVDGIHLNFNRHNITIKNGTVRDFFGHGIFGQASDGCIIEDVRVINNGMRGIYLQQYARIKDCMVINNRADGIFVPQNVIITGSMVVGNGTVDNQSGVVVLSYGGLVTESIASTNTGFGMRVDGGGLISACASHGNGSFGIFGGTEVLTHGSSSTGNDTNTINGPDIDCFSGP